MGIFEGEDETAVDLGRGSELSASVHHDLRLDPVRHAIGALLDETGARVGTIVTEVEVWFRKEGVLRRRDVDPAEVVNVEVGFDPVQLDDDGYPDRAPVGGGRLRARRRGDGRAARRPPRVRRARADRAVVRRGRRRAGARSRGTRASTTPTTPTAG